MGSIQFVKCKDSGDYDITQFDVKLAEQIIVNSQIATQKYRFFDLAIYFTLFAVVTPLVGIPLIVLLHR